MCVGKHVKVVGMDEREIEFEDFVNLGTHETGTVEGQKMTKCRNVVGRA
jgi:hypothetical protein